jgi:hypothetical protein
MRIYNPTYSSSYGPTSYVTPIYPASSYPASSYLAQSYPVQSYPVQSYPVQSYPVQSYPVQSYPVQSYLASYSNTSHAQPAANSYNPYLIRLLTPSENFERQQREREQAQQLALELAQREREQLQQQLAKKQEQLQLALEREEHLRREQQAQQQLLRQAKQHAQHAKQEILITKQGLSTFVEELSQQQQHVETLGQVSREMSAINADLIEVKDELTREECKSQKIITEQQKMILVQQYQLLQPPSLSQPPSPSPPSPQQLQAPQQEQSVEKPIRFDYSKASGLKTEDLLKVLELRRKILYDYRDQLYLNQIPPSTSTSSPQASLRGEAFNERKELNPGWDAQTM